MTEGIIVGHHDGTGAVLRITQSGAVRGKSWTRQALSDALGFNNIGRSVSHSVADGGS